MSDIDDFDQPNPRKGNTNNPLAKYMRMPGVDARLPTKGAFMPFGSIDFTMTGGVPVFPMRNFDEVLLKSPDALMSGYAIEELLKSCVPAIKYPRLISNPDLDVLLLAIRAATYGDVMTFSVTCPSCSHVSEEKQKLSNFMSTIQYIEPENIVRLNDELILYVRPYNLENSTKIGVISFEEARKYQSLDLKGADDFEKSSQINLSMKRLDESATEALASCIVKIVTPEGIVADRQMILEFILNISKKWTDDIKEKLEELNNKGIDRSCAIVCKECKHEWKTEIELNPSTFFAASS